MTTITKSLVYLNFFIIGAISVTVGFFLGNKGLLIFGSEIMLSLLVLSFLLPLILYIVKNSKTALIGFLVMFIAFIVRCYFIIFDLPCFIFVILIPELPFFPLILITASLFLRKQENLSYALRAASISYAGVVFSFLALFMMYPPCGTV